MTYSRRFPAILALALVLMLLVACSSPTASGSDSSSHPRNGVFIDGPLAGLVYRTSSGLEGTTDANGVYQYREGDTVQFFLGHQSLGEPVIAAATVTPLTVCEATELDATPEGTKASNMIRLFLALDTGENPFGLTLPPDLSNAVSNIDLDELLEAETFAEDAKAMIAAALEVVESEVEVPAASEAEDHWKLSQQLAQELTTVADDTLVLAVRVPEGYVGKTLKLTYHAELPPPGKTSYQSGEYHTIAEADNGIVTFRGPLHASRWQLTLSLFQNNEKVVVGDLLSFFHKEGFGQTLPDGYDLDLTQGPRFLQADLSGGEAIRIAEVHAVEGSLVLQKALPDDTADWSLLEKRMAEFSVFNAVLNDGKDVAMFSISLPLGEPNSWISQAYDDSSTTEIESILCWKIPFATTLPAGYAYRLQSYFRTQFPGGYDSYSFAALPALTEDNLTVELKTLRWNVPSQ